MSLIAFVSDQMAVGKILDHLGPSTPSHPRRRGSGSVSPSTATAGACRPSGRRPLRRPAVSPMWGSVCSPQPGPSHHATGGRPTDAHHPPARPVSTPGPLPARRESPCPVARPQGTAHVPPRDYRESDQAALTVATRAAKPGGAPAVAAFSSVPAGRCAGSGRSGDGDVCAPTVIQQLPGVRRSRLELKTSTP
jgi:hypothetical protein